MKLATEDAVLMVNYCYLLTAGERGRDFERSDHDREAPKKGNTVYVRGHGLTEEMLRKAFNSVGEILNLTTERNKK